MQVLLLIVAALVFGGCQEKIHPGTEKVERPGVSGIRVEIASGQMEKLPKVPLTKA